MPDIDSFALYRRLLVIIVVTYTLVRLIRFAWRWQLDSRRAERREAVLRKWVVTSVLRLRLRRFAKDGFHILILVVLLGVVLWLQIDLLRG